MLFRAAECYMWELVIRVTSRYLWVWDRVSVCAYQSRYYISRQTAKQVVPCIAIVPKYIFGNIKQWEMIQEEKQKPGVLAYKKEGPAVTKLPIKREKFMDEDELAIRNRQEPFHPHPQILSVSKPPVPFQNLS